MAKRARVWTGTGWDDLAVQLPDLSNYSTTSQMNTAITNNVGLVPILTQTIGNSVQTIVVNNAFSSSYDAYKIIITGGIGSVGSAMTMVLGSSTASYKYTLMYTNFGTSTVNVLTSSSASNWNFAGAVTTDSIVFNADVLNPFATKKTAIYSQYMETNANGTFTGYHDVAASYTGFTISSAAAFTGGTIRVYGYKN